MACEKEDPEPTGDSADLQYIGTWSGTTNEGLLVSISIDSINQWTRLRRFTVNFYRDTVYSHVSSNIDGLTKVENGEFSADMGQGNTLNGKFTGSDLLTGSINIDNRIRNFSCTNEEKEINMNSVSQARFRFRQNSYVIRQDQDDMLARLEEHLTYYNRKYFITSLKPVGLFHDSVRLIQITKGRLSDIWNEDAFVQYFTPGKRNYSIGGRNGIEIIISDSLDNYTQYSTSYGEANQQDSRFAIIETQKLENDLNEKVIVKLKAEFSCMMYDDQGNAVQLTDGVFIGFFEQYLEK